MGSEEELKLFGFWVSPFVLRIKWALELKGVEYEYVEQDIINKSPLLLELNPVYKKVPVLIHGGRTICESLVILEYIDETWVHNPILPQDPYEKAMVRVLAKVSEEKLLGALSRLFIQQGKEQETLMEEAKEALEIFEGVIKEKKFVGGEKIQYLDIVLGWTCIWLEATAEVMGIKLIDSERFPHYIEWAKTFREFPLIKENIPPLDKVLVYLNNLYQVVLATTVTK